MHRSDARRVGRLKPLGAGHLVRELRELAGFTPKAFCNRIAMGVSQLSDIERGIRSLSLRRARQMATVLDSPFIEIVRLVLQDRLDEAGFGYLRVELVIVRDEKQTTERR